jgi:hypothetical protein
MNTASNIEDESGPRLREHAQGKVNIFDPFPLSFQLIGKEAVCAIVSRFVITEQGYGCQMNTSRGGHYSRKGAYETTI